MSELEDAQESLSGMEEKISETIALLNELKNTSAAVSGYLNTLPENTNAYPDEFIVGDLGVVDDSYVFNEYGLAFKIWHTHGVPESGHFEIRPYLASGSLLQAALLSTTSIPLGNGLASGSLLQIALEPNPAAATKIISVELKRSDSRFPVWLCGYTQDKTLTVRLYTHEGSQLSKNVLGNPDPPRITLHKMTAIEPSDPLASTENEKRIFDPSQLVTIDLAKGKENEDLWTEPLYKWFKSPVTGVPCRLLYRPEGSLTRAQQEMSRHAYSTRHFYSGDGTRGISNGTGNYRLFKVGILTSILGVTNLGLKKPNFIPNENQNIFGYNEAEGKIEVRTADISSLVSKSGELVSPSDNTGVELSDTGVISEDGWTCLHPTKNISDGKWWVVLYNLFTQEVERIDLSAYPMEGLTTGSQHLQLDNVGIDPTGQHLIIQPVSSGGQIGDRGYVLSRAYGDIWEMEAYWVEGGHGDFVIAEDGRSTWQAIGWDHSGQAPGGSTGVFEYDLVNPSRVRTVQGLTQQWNNRPLSFGGHLSGLASIQHPGLSAVGTMDPEAGRHIALIHTAHEGKWALIDSLPTLGEYASYQVQPHPCIRPDGQRLVAAFKRQDYPEQPGLIEYDLSEFYT